jgi:methyl-accepting chemotaxis protein
MFFISEAMSSYYYKYNINNVNSGDRCQNNGKSYIRYDNNIFYRFYNFYINSFFLNAHSNEIKKHRKNIIKKYKKWKKIDFNIDKYPLGVDIQTFIPNKLKLGVVELINPIVNKSNHINDTIDEMALSHLKFYYEKDNDLFSKIYQCQNKFNEEMNRFIDNTRTQLKKITGSNDDEKIHLLLRYYLVKIKDASRFSDIKKSINDLQQPFKEIDVGGRDIISNPFPEKEEEIRKEMLEKYTNNLESLNAFNTDISNLRQLISDFQDLLTPIIKTDSKKLQGICSEEKSSKIYKIISRLPRKKRSESK